MIIQEINLYQDRFKEQRIMVSATHLLLIVGLMLVVLALSSYWYDRQYRQAEQQNLSLLATKEQSTVLLESHRKKLQALLADTRLDSEISKISTDIALRKRIINFVSNKQFGSGKGFSSHLGELAEININNVWLNEISLAGEAIKLSGSALKAEAIPEYFNLFRQRKLFNGKVFEVFQLDRLQEQDWKVDFLIASRDASNE